MQIKNNIKRLLQYRMCLVRFRELGFEKVYSYSLAREAGVTPEQIRKDFSQFGIKGNKKGGYQVSELLDSLNYLFGKNELQDVILVGMGNIGIALSRYNCGFIQRRQYICAGFDIDPAKFRKSHTVPVYPVALMPSYIKENGISVAIIAVPALSAQDVCNQLVDCGIRGIMNFAPVILKVPKHVVVNNINLCNELESIIYTAIFARDEMGLKVSGGRRE
jgi:redox-sensing transcriptional repressor